VLTIKQTAATFGAATSTIHRLLNDGIIAGEQLTPGTPRRIREFVSPTLCARVSQKKLQSGLIAGTSLRRRGR
jgi:hypothetical protein